MASLGFCFVHLPRTPGLLLRKWLTAFQRAADLLRFVHSERGVAPGVARQGPWISQTDLHV
jgi:hypothetical protein